MSENPSLLRFDALQEVVNIGGGHAATALSKMIGNKVEMDVPFVALLPYEKVYETIQSDDTIVKAVLSKLIGREHGVFLFVIDPKDAEALAHIVLPENDELSEELIDSALTELSNILVQSFLQAVMQLIDKPLFASVPVMTMDMFGSILSSVYMEQNQFSEEVFIIKNNFYSSGRIIEGSLYFVPKPKVLEQLLKELGI
ncbi:chemotaxis protein CheC [Alkalibacterium subtropicum]|uniref:Chemotaxis protein CheC n=1 Tax=Alkalibacterium subtropicum TaxID=753702 RepID=A0A1I1ITE4_9LACT|nr:chemotaxis protein CheC [Alkalibacterium subtropicum]SFC39465.1 chemotaxis protein CheC [Alkalibacterium subtropicum]